jgi:hypothetical protein
MQPFDPRTMARTIEGVKIANRSRTFAPFDPRTAQASTPQQPWLCGRFDRRTFGWFEPIVEFAVRSHHTPWGVNGERWADFGTLEK